MPEDRLPARTVHAIRSDLSEHPLDRTQVEAIGGQVEDTGACCNDGVLEPNNLWEGCPSPRRCPVTMRCQELPNVGEKYFSVIKTSNTIGPKIPVERRPAAKLVIFQ